MYIVYAYVADRCAIIDCCWYKQCNYCVITAMDYIIVWVKCLFLSLQKRICDLSAFACFDRSKHIQRWICGSLQRLSSDDSFRGNFFHVFNITWQLTTGYKGLKLSRWIYLVLYSLWVETRLHFSVGLNSGTFQDIETQSETSLLNALFSHLFFMAVSGASFAKQTHIFEQPEYNARCSTSLEWRSLKWQQNAKIS